MPFWAVIERSSEDGLSAWPSGGSAGPGHGPPPAWSINGIQDGGFEVSPTAHVHTGQVHQPAPRPKAAARPSTSVPASLSDALTDGPEPHIVSPERFREVLRCVEHMPSGAAITSLFIIPDGHRGASQGV